MVSRVQSAEDGQIADLVGGDFNCTPESPFWRGLANLLGPSVQELGGTDPFVTYGGLSAKSGAGEMIDYIFIRKRTAFQELGAVSRAVFAAASVEQRLSDHLGIEAVVNLSPAPSLVGGVGSPMPTIAAGRAVYEYDLFAGSK